MRAADPGTALAADIVICTYTDDRWPLLVRAVESALAQRLAPARLIISVDHNRALFERCRSQCRDRRPELQKSGVIFADGRDSGLLQHDLAEPDAVGVGAHAASAIFRRDAPRQYAGMPVVPIQEAGRVERLCLLRGRVVWHDEGMDRRDRRCNGIRHVEQGQGRA